MSLLCFVVKRKLERAIEIALKKDMDAKFNIQYHSFLLDPTLTVDE